MKILSTGEKIRQLRTDLGLKQDDISNDEVTRSLISMIENNKRSLTYRTAKIISKSLNQYYINLGAQITPDLLLESEVEQAQRIIRERLDEMKQLLDNPTTGTEVQINESFQKLIDFAREWKLDQMIAQLHETRGRFYYKTYQYNEALKDLFEALEYHLQRENYDKVASMYNLIGSIHYQLSIYDQALLYYEKCFSTVIAHRPSNYDQMELFSKVNKIRCYIKLNRYDMAFKELNHFKEKYKTEDRYLFEAFLMEGNAYLEIQNYDKASKIFQKLLKKSTRIPPDILFLIYETYADLFQRQGEYEKSIGYIESAFEYIDHGYPNIVAYLFLYEARAYQYLNQLEDAHRVIEKGLTFAEKISKIDVIIDLTILKAQMDIGAENYNSAEEKLHLLKDYIERKGLKSRRDDLYLYFMELYCKKKEYQKCLAYIMEAQQLRNKEKMERR